MRRLVFAVAVGILAWAALVVPVPLLALEPVQARPVDAIVEVGRADVEVPGSYLFTAVRVGPQTAVGAIEVWLDAHKSLEFAPAVVPAGVDPGEFVELQRRQFEESVRIAAAVGMRSAGREVTIAGEGAAVVQTVPGTPADEVLRPDDVIVGAAGQPVELASELAAIASRQQPGDRLELTVRRGDRQLTDQVEIVELPQGLGPGIGVLASTVDLRVETPVEVVPRAGTNIGGPSAGLMIALAVHEALTDEEVAGGRTIAGTGVIDTSGNVGPVSGIREKVEGARRAGADVFLVPAEQAEEATDAAPDGLEVVPVASLEEAVAALTARD